PFVDVLRQPLRNPPRHCTERVGYQVGRALENWKFGTERQQRIAHLAASRADRREGTLAAYASDATIATIRSARHSAADKLVSSQTITAMASTGTTPPSGARNGVSPSR